MRHIGSIHRTTKFSHVGRVILRPASIRKAILGISGKLQPKILLAEYLPMELKANATVIYGDLTVQLGYEWGSVAREAIVRAYGDTQRLMLIASLVASVGSLVWVGIMRDETLRDKEQTTGVLL